MEPTADGSVDLSYVTTLFNLVKISHKIIDYKKVIHIQELYPSSKLFKFSTYFSKRSIEGFKPFCTEIKTSYQLTARQMIRKGSLQIIPIMSFEIQFSRRYKQYLVCRKELGDQVYKISLMSLQFST